MAEEPKDAAAADKAPEKPKSRLSIIQLALIVVLSLVSSAGGGAISGYLISKSLPHPEAASTEKEKASSKLAKLMENGAVVPLEPFIVNLADKESPRYLRIKLSLLVDDKTKVAAVIGNQALIQMARDLILQTLTNKRSDELINEDGKNELRKQLVNRLEELFHEPELADIMITEFVIQL